MLLQEPTPSPYDLRFNVFGFPVRIAWSFWVAGIAFGYALVQSFDVYWNRQEDLSPGFAPLLLLWLACLLLSILVHEMGHALAFRQNGIDSRIVLYYLGGLAIPTGSSSSEYSYNRFGPKQDIWVSFAGPLAQMVSAVLLMGAVKFAGYRLDVLAQMPFPLNRIPGITQGAAITSPGLDSLVWFYVYPSVLWALMNLVPVWPLDGGHIARSVIQLRGGDMTQSLWISVIAAGLMAVYGFTTDNHFMGILFLVLGIANFQALQQSGGARFG